jgi:hypothetical protein
MKLLNLFNSVWRMLCVQGNMPLCSIEARKFSSGRRIDIFTNNVLLSEVDLVCPLVLCQTLVLRSGQITVTSWHNLVPRCSLYLQWNSGLSHSLGIKNFNWPTSTAIRYYLNTLSFLCCGIAVSQNVWYSLSSVMLSSQIQQFVSEQGN